MDSELPEPYANETCREYMHRVLLPAGTPERMVIHVDPVVAQFAVPPATIIQGPPPSSVSAVSRLVNGIREVLGELIDGYEERSETHGRAEALRWWCVQAAKSIWAAMVAAIASWIVEKIAKMLW